MFDTDPDFYKGYVYASSGAGRYPDNPSADFLAGYDAYTHEGDCEDKGCETCAPDPDLANKADKEG